MDNKIAVEWWKSMDSAPKQLPKTDHQPVYGPWILGVDQFGGQRVIRWTTEYPESEGTWMFAYEPNDYIVGIQSFVPIAWMPLMPTPKNIKKSL